MLKLKFVTVYVACLIAATIVTLFSCTMQKSTQAPLKQGIEGTIFRASGNQMPMKGAERAKPKPLECEVYIYNATTAQQAKGEGTLYSQINTKLITKVKTDKTGHYQAALPPGLYSVFVKEGNQYFASESDGKGTLNPAEVAIGKVTTRNITVNFDAAY